MVEDSHDSARTKMIQMGVAQSRQASSILGSKLHTLLKMHVQEDSYCAECGWDEGTGDEKGEEGIGGGERVSNSKCRVTRR